MEEMYIALLAGGLTVLIPSLYLLLRRRNRENAKWEEEYPRSKFQYCGMTILFYNESHGNQIEYLDPNGKCYLWYPGNSVILVGRWRADENTIYFQYGMNTYNPVTGIIGGGWEGCPIALWSSSITDSAPGDVVKLASQRLPFILSRHPKIQSINDQ